MNRYIIGDSSSGKTRALLELAKETNSVFVCQNPDAMCVKAQNYGLYRIEFCGYDDFKTLPEGRSVVVDELTDFFKHYHNVALEGFNLTTD